MKKTASILALAGLLVCAGPAAAKSIPYEGKTSSGHKIVFKLQGNKVVNPEAGIGVTCLPIQGRGGTPKTGADYMYPLIKIKLGTKRKFKTEQTPAFYFRDVEVNQEFSSRKGRNGRITGRLRMQYAYMVSTWPIGTFNVYSCLGTATFKAKPKR